MRIGSQADGRLAMARQNHRIAVLSWFAALYWLRKVKIATVLIAVLSGTTEVVSSAELSIISVDSPAGVASYILVDGDIVEGDWWKFSQLLREIPDIDGVLLRSNGGAADDGLAMAKQTFEHGLSTMVTGTCHSICAVIFLAGRDRYLARGANLTVHSAYRQLGDWVVEDHIANGTVAWFIGHMGYPLALARLWVSTPSDTVSPITFEMNEKLKLGFTIIEGAPTHFAGE